MRPVHQILNTLVTCGISVHVLLARIAHVILPSAGLELWEAGRFGMYGSSVSHSWSPSWRCPRGCAKLGLRKREDSWLVCESQACGAGRQGCGSGLREPAAAWSKKSGKTWGMLALKRAEQHLHRALAAPGYCLPGTLQVCQYVGPALCVLWSVTAHSVSVLLGLGDSGSSHKTL